MGKYKNYLTDFAEIFTAVVAKNYSIIETKFHSVISQMFEIKAQNLGNDEKPENSITLQAPF